MVVDSGYLYVEDRSNFSVRRIDLATREVTTMAPVGPRFGDFSGCLGGDGQGSLFVCFNRLPFRGIRKIDLASGTSAGFSGSVHRTSWEDGWGDGAGFSRGPSAAAVASGSLYAIALSAVRRIELPSGRTTWFAGLADNGGYVDGPLLQARFASPTGIAADGQGNLYVADALNYVIRKIDLATGLVSTIMQAGQSGAVEVGSGAFPGLGRSPRTLRATSSYVSQRITSSTPIGGYEPRHHLCGHARYRRNLDGERPSARVSYPGGLALDLTESLWRPAGRFAGSTFRAA
jgi:hypothetical protein